MARGMVRLISTITCLAKIAKLAEIAHRGRGHDGAGFGDGGGLDHRNVHRRQLPLTAMLNRFQTNAGPETSRRLC